MGIVQSRRLSGPEITEMYAWLIANTTGKVFVLTAKAGERTPLTNMIIVQHAKLLANYEYYGNEFWNRAITVEFDQPDEAMLFQLKWG